MSGLLLHTPYNNVSQVILTGKQYSTYGLARSLPFYSLEKGSNRDTYTVAYLLCLGPWKAMCNLQMICKMIGFKLWTIRSQFAHTHGMYRYVCKYHSNDNVKRASLKLILTFLNVKFFLQKYKHFTELHHHKQGMIHSFIIKFYSTWRKKMYKRKLYRNSFRLSEPMFDNVWRTTHMASCNIGSDCCFTWNAMTINKSIYTIAIINQ